MWKTAITDEVAISANADMGRQYIDCDGQQLWHVGLYLSSRHRAPVQWKVGFAISKDHASALGGLQRATAIPVRWLLCACRSSRSIATER